MDEMTKCNVPASGSGNVENARAVRNYVLRATCHKLAHDKLDHRLRNTASTTSSVLLLPPRSGVSTRPSLMT